MKRKIYLGILLFISTLLVLLVIPHKKRNNLVIISDYIYKNLDISSKITDKSKYDTIYQDYKYNSINTQNLLRYIQEDTTKISTTDKSLRNQIKDSSSLVLSIGMDDFINKIQVNVEEKKLEYDKDVLSLHADILVNYYHLIIEELTLINSEIKLLCTSLYYPYPYIIDQDLINFYNLVNQDLKLIVENENGVFFDISSYSQEKYLDSITDYKLNTIALNHISDELIGIL